MFTVKGIVRGRLASRARLLQHRHLSLTSLRSSGASVDLQHHRGPSPPTTTVVMAASALPETLRSITAVKLAELTQQRDKFEAAKAHVHTKVAAAQTPLEKARILVRGVGQLKNAHVVDEDEVVDDGAAYVSPDPLAHQLQNLLRLLRQAEVDPSIQASVVADIRASLDRELDLESIRHQHAQFFSALVTEWVSTTDASPSETATVNAGRQEMHEQRQTWEDLVFTEHHVDTEAIKTYLQDLFRTEQAHLSHQRIVKDTKKFCSELWDRKDLFTPVSLRTTMQSLIASGLLPPTKNATLRTFLGSPEVLEEVADVLNMRYLTLSSWTWTMSAKGVPIEMRRQLNGKYRVFMDEDILDAILLHDLGLKFSVHFKRTLTTFFKSYAWKQSHRAVPQKDVDRRAYFLGPRTSTLSVDSVRHDNYSKEYFMTLLPMTEDEGARDYDGSNASVSGEAGQSKSPLDLKHGLLHALVAELILAKELNPKSVHTVVRSDFKWFGPALPHETIFTVLEFFGIDEKWMSIFRRFLTVPMSFKQDGEDAQVRSRVRGVPVTHTLSDVMGEVVLFAMDFAVNQATSSYLYRLHDDFWLWGSEESCIQGWNAMTKFAATMGLEFNEEKTGTVRLGDASATTDVDILPKGDVRWGFLKLDAKKQRFVVDDAQVDKHIQELKHQLSFCKSILGYVQSYNAYAARFFSNNFGKPSYAFGREHVDMMIHAFARIQQSLFPTGSVTDHLNSIVAQRFGIKDLPQGCWYFPVDLGGLELVNPLIDLLGMRTSLRDTPERMLQKTGELEEQTYYRAQAVFKQNGSTGLATSGRGNILPSEIGIVNTDFMSKEEFFRYRSQQSDILATLYCQYLEVADVQEMNTTSELKALLIQGSPGLHQNGSKILAEFDRMDTYWRWIVALYGKDIVQRFGRVRMIERGQVPLGVVSLMKKEKVQWRS